MKQGIHPNYHIITVKCSCKNTFQVGSTIDEDILDVEICSNCHPFFTGEQKLVDTQRTVEKFERRMQIAEEKQKEQEEIDKRRSKKEGSRAKKRQEKLARELGIKDIGALLGNTPISAPADDSNSQSSDDDSQNNISDDPKKKKSDESKK